MGRLVTCLGLCWDLFFCDIWPHYLCRCNKAVAVPAV
jgi:hypothetical protein